MSDKIRVDHDMSAVEAIHRAGFNAEFASGALLDLNRVQVGLNIPFSNCMASAQSQHVHRENAEKFVHVVDELYKNDDAFLKFLNDYNQKTAAEAEEHSLRFTSATSNEIMELVR